MSFLICLLRTANAVLIKIFQFYVSLKHYFGCVILKSRGPGAVSIWSLKGVSSQ